MDADEKFSLVVYEAGHKSYKCRITKGSPEEVMAAFYAELHNFPLPEEICENGLILKFYPRNISCSLFLVSGNEKEGTITDLLFTYKENNGVKKLTLFNPEKLAEISAQFPDYRERILL